YHYIRTSILVTATATSITSYLFFFHSYLLLLFLHSFPTRRSSDLFNIWYTLMTIAVVIGVLLGGGLYLVLLERKEDEEEPPAQKDRKSTRLNSSHVSISYAVFCLKKKKRRIKISNRLKKIKQQKIVVNKNQLNRVKNYIIHSQYLYT